MLSKVNYGRGGGKIVPYDDALTTLYPGGFYKDRKKEDEQRPIGRYMLGGLLFPKGKLVPYDTEEQSVVETKYRNVTISFAATSDTFQYTLLNGLAKGTGVGDRVGNRVTNRVADIRISFAFYSDAVGGVINRLFGVRMQVVYDKQTNGLVCPSPFGGFYSSSESIYRDRFIILYDEVVYPKHFREMRVWDPTNAEWYLPEQMLVFRHIKLLLDMPTTFNTGNAGTVADINTGSLYLVLLPKGTSVAVGSLRYVDMEGNCEFRWKDE